MKTFTVIARSGSDEAIYSSKRQNRLLRSLQSLAMTSMLLFCAIALTACTIQPLYGTFTVNNVPPPGAHLSQVEVSPIHGRTGIALRNELIFVLTGGGEKVVNGRYRLDIVLEETITPSQYEQISGRATVGLLYTAANYVLIDTATGEQLYKSRSFARTSYDRDIQRFANIRAQRDAEDRAMKVLAQEIRNSLAAHFAQMQS